MRVALGSEALIALNLCLVVGLAVLVRIVRDIREQQRRIIRQLETQTRVVHNAARLAAERLDEPPP
ncbi:hypothetical protein [Spirillospora sp. NPDC047279]|uniref:hypothetical protein n=1 Tax=Spirillospora sp. NPDC047279 TaxID=3155478 RepID=UPI0034063DE5